MSEHVWEEPDTSNLRLKSRTIPELDVAVFLGKNPKRGVHIVNLLLCVSGAALFQKVPKCKEKAMQTCYASFANLFEETFPGCCVARLEGNQLFRRFRDNIKKAILDCGAEVLNRIDTITRQPTSGKTWLDVCEEVIAWLHTRERRGLALKNLKRSVMKANKKGRSSLVPASQLPSDWQCDALTNMYEHAMVLVIQRFCPLLCERLGFEPSPPCFALPRTNKRDGEHSNKSRKKKSKIQKEPCDEHVSKALSLYFCNSSAFLPAKVDPRALEIAKLRRQVLFA